MELHTRFERLGGPIETPSAETIEAALAGGRRAVRRRRTAQTVAGLAFAGAALAAGVTVTAGSGTAPEQLPGVSQVQAAGLTLVDYRGPQPRNFTVDKVPAGFFIQNDDEGGLTIAPTSVQNPSPGVDPSADPMYDPRNLTGKIGIYLEQRAFRGAVSGEEVSVGDHRAILHTNGPTRQLLIEVSPTVYATVQFDVPLDRAQMLELGAGLHVHREAVERADDATGEGKTD